MSSGVKLFRQLIWTWEDWEREYWVREYFIWLAIMKNAFAFCSLY